MLKRYMLQNKGRNRSEFVLGQKSHNRKEENMVETLSEEAKNKDMQNYFKIYLGMEATKFLL